MKSANGDKSIFYRASKGRWFGAAYLLQPDGTYARREVSNMDREVVVRKLREMPSRSDQGIPAEATNWQLEAFLRYWLEHIVEPAKKPKTYQGYELVARVHLSSPPGPKSPGLSTVSRSACRTATTRLTSPRSAASSRRTMCQVALSAPWPPRGAQGDRLRRRTDHPDAPTRRGPQAWAHDRHTGAGLRSDDLLRDAGTSPHADDLRR